MHQTQDIGQNSADYKAQQSTNLRKRAVPLCNGLFAQVNIRLFKIGMTSPFVISSSHQKITQVNGILHKKNKIKQSKSK